MNSPDTSDVSAALDAVEKTFGREGKRSDVAVVDGFGVRVSVDRGHLVLVDGLGEHRRERRYHKATHGLSRLVILGSTGTVSLEALRYCDRLGIPLAVIDASSSRVSFTSALAGTDDASLRRVQALAPEGEIGLDIARMLLSSKLEGQAKVVRNKLGMDDPADVIMTLGEQLGDALTHDETREFEASAAACYFNAWSRSEIVVPKFIAKDRGRVPGHWQRFDGRRSVLHSKSGNRKAERPVNAILNYLFALVEVEAILACHAMGLDPGLGITHLDARSRQSMALDLMEPVRPVVEAWTLDLLADHTFRRGDFTETPEGHVRLLAPFTHELAGSMGQWRREVAPWAEKVAHMLGEAMKGRYQAVTPLSGRRAVEARRTVKARKAKEAIYREVFTREPPAPKQRPRQMQGVALDNCRTCGGPLARGQHVNCPSCWERLPGQDFHTRGKRGAAISASKVEGRRWSEEHPLEGRDLEEFRTLILPGLEGVPLSKIMRACGVAKSTASAIRSGKRFPAERHWVALASLGATDS